MSFKDEREMHKATCSDCGKECEVPFKPDEDRPVYCRDCFQKHRKPRSFQTSLSIFIQVINPSLDYFGMNKKVVI